MNNDLISREALKKELNSRVFQEDYATTLLLSSFNEIIDNAPTVTPKQGEWIDTGSGQECNVCHEIQYGYDNFRHFCANCGAKMKGGAE